MNSQLTDAHSSDKRIIITRHGQTDWNIEARLQGQTNVPLNRQGQNQAKFLGDYLEPISITRAVSSPLSRASETARIILRDRPIRLELISEFREITHGAWEGYLESEIDRLHPYQFHQWKTNPRHCYKPDGESLSQFEARLMPAWEKLAQSCSDDGHQTILLVTHKFVIQAILCRVHSLGLNHLKDFPQGNCAINIIDYRNGVPHVRVTNLNAWESNLIGA